MTGCNQPKGDLVDSIGGFESIADGGLCQANVYRLLLTGFWVWYPSWGNDTARREHLYRGQSHHRWNDLCG